MPIQSKFVFIAAMDVEPDKEALFNEVYDTEHVPELLKVPGVRSVTRCKGRPFAMSLAGETTQKAHEGPSYYAVYEIDNADVIASPAWATAVEKGRWPTHVRPFTRNRRHMMMQIV